MLGRFGPHEYPLGAELDLLRIAPFHISRLDFVLGRRRRRFDIVLALTRRHEKQIQEELVGAWVLVERICTLCRNTARSIRDKLIRM
jgi:hypothetical protein